MNKQVLSPFDCDMCAMIEDITKQEIEVTASDTSIRLSWAQNGSEGNDKAEGQRIEAVKHAMPTFDDPGRMNAVIDELADLNAVVFHSAAILGIPQRDLLEMAYDKVKGRQTDPNYKRTHPHEQKHCGNCDSITSEDANGNGYCYTTESPVNCENPGCKQWQKRHSQFMNDKNNRAMINREQFINEIAEVVNRNSMEKAFNDTPDYILARIAVEAMEMFTRASAHRDDFHEFRTADYARKHKAICESEKKAKLVNTCKGSPIIYVCPTVQMENQPERKREYKKPEAFDVPKEVEAMAEFLGEMFPGTTVEIHRVEMPKRNPRDKRRAKNKRKGGNNGKK